ncbi:cobyric acid synthase, partial [Corynebacterium sp.]
DRGGVLAHFVGTHAILSPEDRARITGFIVNKFRGDVSLLTPGLDVVREHTGVPVLGVVSFIPGLWIDAEDSLGTVAGASVGPANAPLGTETLSVAAIRLPRVSNATDIEALACEPGVHVQWTVDPSVVARADLVVLPGTKSTVADLKWLRERGLDDVLENRAARGLPLIGICGGFQMLCTTITDSVESVAGTVNGLGVFDTDIEFAGTKTLVSHPDGSYEVHNGQVVRSSEAPFITEPEEGARRGMVMGTHRHGYLENDQARRELLMEVAVAVGRDGFEVSPNTSFAGERLLQVDLLANAVEKYLAGPALAQATGIEQLG